MVEAGIIRQPKESDREYIGLDNEKVSKFLRQGYSEEERFTLELQKHELIATKKGLPFAWRAVKEEYENKRKSQVDEQLRLHGQIVEKIKVPKVDWTKYSDLKNFELISEEERVDDNLTNRNPGLYVQVATKNYKFKGYSNNYIVQESGPDSIKRAQLKRDTELKKVISV